MTWGQARLVTFTLQTYLKILKCLLLRVNESKPPNSVSIVEDYFNGNDAGDAYWQGHRERSSEVMWHHKSFFSINHDMMVLKTCKWYIPNCSPGQGVSIGMQHDHTPQPHWWMTWPWPRVKFPVDLWMSSHTYFASPRREQRKCIIIFLFICFLVQKLHK